MAQDEQVALRLPAELLERAEALVEVLGAVPEIAAHGTVTRASVLRMALVQGMAALERRHPGSRKKTARR